MIIKICALLKGALNGVILTDTLSKSAADKRLAMRISLVSVIGNLLLSGFKLMAGILAHSGAMISDAVHSASDLFSTIVVMIGINISSKDADDNHPYGHERLECITAIALAVMLAATGLVIGYFAVGKIISSASAPLEAPGVLALVAAIISIVTKEAMYQATMRVAKKIRSDALRADAWHHRSDALSSIGSLVGIAGARMGLPVLDPIAAVVICLMILKVSFDILKDAVSKLTDNSCGTEIDEALRKLAESQEGVKHIDMLRTRTFASKFYVDIEIALDGNLSLHEAHKITEMVHDAIEEKFPDAKHCMVHANPYEAEKYEKGNCINN